MDIMDSIEEKYEAEIEKRDKRYRDEKEHSAWLQKQIDEDVTLIEEQDKQIAELKAELKEQFEQGISIIHDQGAENILLKDQITTLKAEIERLREALREIIANHTLCGVAATMYCQGCIDDFDYAQAALAEKGASDEK